MRAPSIKDLQLTTNGVASGLTCFVIDVLNDVICFSSALIAVGM